MLPIAKCVTFQGIEPTLSKNVEHLSGQRERKGERERARERESERERERERDRERERGDRETDRQTDRQTETDRQTDKDRLTARGVEIGANKEISREDAWLWVGREIFTSSDLKNNNKGKKISFVLAFYGVL